LGLKVGKTVVISLGGSIIYPDEPDYRLMEEFKGLIKEFINESNFIIYCGGGKLARNLQKEASSKGDVSQEELDWIGIEATRKNAEMLKKVFGDIASEKIIIDPTEEINIEKPVVIAAGWKPGWSTDYDAVLVAKNIGAEMVINMSNIDYVYDSDPNKNPDAKALKSINWGDFRKLVGDSWKPGLNMPFDPIASKEAEKLGLKVLVIGKSLGNLKDVLEGKGFEGTVIE
jgi:uridylate kinase